MTPRNFHGRGVVAALHLVLVREDAVVVDINIWWFLVRLLIYFATTS